MAKYSNSFSATTENGKKVPTMTEYIKNPLSGKLRGVTYEDGKIIDVHIRDTDDVVKVFVPVRHGRWIHEETEGGFHVWSCSRCGRGMNGNPKGTNLYCYHCGAKMDGGADNEM